MSLIYEIYFQVAIKCVLTPALYTELYYAGANGVITV